MPTTLITPVPTWRKLTLALYVSFSPTANGRDAAIWCTGVWRASSAPAPPRATARAATKPSTGRELDRITRNVATTRARQVVRGPANLADLYLFSRRRRHRYEILAGIDEAIPLHAVLLVVELTIAAAEGEELAVRP